MEISQITLFFLLVHCFFFGAAVGALYDLCRSFRVMAGVSYSPRGYPRLYSLRLPISRREMGRGERHVVLQNLLINIGDFFCVITAALGAVLLSYGYNNGRVRFFSLAAIALGVMLYRVSLSKLIMLISEPVALLVKYLFLSFFEILRFPLKKLYELMRKNAKNFSSLYIFTLENRKKKLYNIRDEVFFPEDVQRRACDLGKKLKWKYKTGGTHGGEK